MGIKGKFRPLQQKMDEFEHSSGGRTFPSPQGVVSKVARAKKTISSSLPDEKKIDKSEPSKDSDT